MLVHPHPLSWAQSPLVLVSLRICHPDEKSFRRLNQGRFSPGCPPPPLPSSSRCLPHRPWISLLYSQQPRGGYRGCGSMCVCVGVCMRDGGGRRCVRSEEKKYIAVGSETAGSQRLQDGGMLSVHNGPSPHWRDTQTQGFEDENNFEYTHYCVMCKETQLAYPGDTLYCDPGVQTALSAGKNSFARRFHVKKIIWTEVIKSTHKIRFHIFKGKF